MKDKVFEAIQKSKFKPLLGSGGLNLSPSERKRLDDALVQLVESARVLNDPVMNEILRSKFGRIDG
jgi:hypothetical protein